VTEQRDYAGAAAFRAGLRRFSRRSEELARAAGITPRQYLVLLMIAAGDEGASTVSTLVAKLQLTQSAVTELVQRAEEAGLISREQSKSDGRVVHLRLTELGEEKLAAVYDALGPERLHLRTMFFELHE
jgi:DNA-binding MarR family transcriptional regulator